MKKFLLLYSYSVPFYKACGAPEGLGEGSYPTMEELIEKFSSEGGAR